MDAWADYWASAKVDAVALSVSGPIAFYPTEIPFYRRSPYLNGRDLFGECVAAAKKRGIRVFGRMSPDIHWEDAKLLAANPLWFRRDQNGKLQYAAPGIIYTCQFGGNFSELQPAILRELNARYEIDGVYMNGWPTEQICYCDNCRKIGEPHSAAYREALLHGAVELVETYKTIVTSKHPDNFYSCNLGGGLRDTALDQWKLTRGALWYTADNQARSGGRCAGVAGCGAGEDRTRHHGRSSRRRGYGELRAQRKLYVAQRDRRASGGRVPHGTDLGYRRRHLVSPPRARAGL